MGGGVGEALVDGGREGEREGGGGSKLGLLWCLYGSDSPLNGCLHIRLAVLHSCTCTPQRTGCQLATKVAPSQSHWTTTTRHTTNVLPSALANVLPFVHSWGSFLLSVTGWMQLGQGRLYASWHISHLGTCTDFCADWSKTCWPSRARARACSPSFPLIHGWTGVPTRGGGLLLLQFDVRVSYQVPGSTFCCCPVPTR